MSSHNERDMMLFKIYLDLEHFGSNATKAVTIGKARKPFIIENYDVTQNNESQMIFHCSRIK